MLDLWVHVLTRVFGRVDCLGCVCVCVCPPDSKIKYSVFYNVCVLMFMYRIIIQCVILLVSFVQLQGQFLCHL